MIKKTAIILRPRTDFGILNTLTNLNQWLMNRNISINFLEKDRAVVEKIFKNIPKETSF